jgi:nicotinate-nucleotide--dimethylbenzimidazole phosphoribosyltransferase
MNQGGSFRALFRPLGRLFRRWGDALLEAPAEPRAPALPAGLQGAPAHWLELARQHAPHLLEDGGMMSFGAPETVEAPSELEPSDAREWEPPATPREATPAEAPAPEQPAARAREPRRPEARPREERAAEGKRAPAAPIVATAPPPSAPPPLPEPVSRRLDVPRPLERLARGRRFSPLLARRPENAALPRVPRTEPSSGEPPSPQRTRADSPSPGPVARPHPAPTPSPSEEPRPMPLEQPVPSDEAQVSAPRLPALPWRPAEARPQPRRAPRPSEARPAPRRVPPSPFPTLPTAEGPRPRTEEPAGDRWPSLPDLNLDDAPSTHDLERLVGRLRREERERGEP